MPKMMRLVDVSAKPLTCSLWICLVGLLSMGWCLRVDYYFDDHMFLVNPGETGDANIGVALFGHQVVEGGSEAWSVDERLLISYGLARLGHLLFGISPVADHAWNLGLHLLMALLVQATTRKFLAVISYGSDEAERRRCAFWSAVLFACHPLCTEAVNYAKCTYMQLVALEALGACWVVLRFRQEARVASFLLAAAGLLGISYFTYPYAFPITLGMGAVMFVFTMRQRGSASGILSTRHRKVSIALGGILLGSLVTAISGILKWWIWHLSMADRSAVSQVLTQSRVFWEYVRRMFFPTQLCSDHLVAWSLGWTDWMGVMALLGLVMTLGTAAWIAWKGRGQLQGGIGLLILLVACPLVIRFPYFTPETMVEYRTYPAMPWVAVLWSAGLFKLTAWMTERIPRLSLALWQFRTLAVVSMIGSMLSALRSREWENLESLGGSTLAQYPENGRVQVQLMAAAMRTNHPEAALLGYAELLEIRKRHRAYNLANAGVRGYDMEMMDRSYLEGQAFATLAVTQMQGLTRGLAFGEAAAWKLQEENAAYFDPKTMPAAALAKVITQLRKRAKEELP